MGAEKILQVVDLRVVRNGLLALDGINLEMDRGAFLAIIGPNGGGKTTFLKAILGQIPAAAGEIRILGWPPRLRQEKRPGAIGYVAQRSLLESDFPVSAFDVAMMGRYGRLGPGRRAGRVDREKARECLALTGLAGLAGRPFRWLSGGQQQRVLIARSLATEPELLILDEPTTGVDAASQEEFYRLLKKLQRDLALSVILVSHDISLVPAYSDQVACLNQRLHLHGKPAEVLRSEALQKAYGCQVDFLFHGEMPHRVVEKHDG
ncbi:MAG TPA: metal ABC transporter ATP-binding protein [bacterium]|uniref:Zinc import ATP-binding protein ZnuC n=1 Tax=candidate division TA06 bacterium ADurb.Bin417 TaxID=1852828 RepID=A0A1V5MEY1_UNCT6|nr:MAG: Zinc import ATP-binding protein ZnuC [candidate division TA06 bacterium ADurb.Bin417]HNQ34788.1 metal ABC transporter ATP-binding protein [bacterium]HNS48384.1 metal ABC transporter ATP-binding protein [bacterium]